MKKTLLALLIAVAMILGLAGCGSPEEEQPEEQVTYDIALVTDAGLLMDGGYSEVAWNTISEYGAANGVSHKYYKASEASEKAYLDTVKIAVEGGAKIIVADGAAFEDVVYQAQEEYPDVKFVLIDAEPTNEESGDSKIAKNTMSVMFASEQAGYLAGYSAVAEGFTKLGFLGGVKNATAMDYEYGFLQGAEAAAQAQGVSVSVRTSFSGAETEQRAVVEKAKTWYQDGTEVILACGKSAELPVIEAAELAEGKVIVCETDKSKLSDTVITSAEKNFPAAIEAALEQYGADAFPGGTSVKYNVADEMIQLELENSRFENFQKGDYKALIKALENGETEVKTHEAGSMKSLDLKAVTIEEK